MDTLRDKEVLEKFIKKVNLLKKNSQVINFVEFVKNQLIKI